MEIIKLCLSIKNLLHPVLEILGFIYNLILDLLHFHKLVKFYGDYNIILSHSTTYYPQGNGLVEFFNKSWIRIIKKLLEENKKAWNDKLKFARWEDRVSTKKFIGTSPFQLFYGTDAIFPTSLGSPVVKYLQEQDIESNPLQRRINQLVEVSQIKDQVVDKAQAF